MSGRIAGLCLPLAFLAIADSPRVDHIACADAKTASGKKLQNPGPISPGEQVRCYSQGGYLIIKLASGEPRLVTSDMDWFTIPANPQPATDSELRIGLALARHAKPAGTRAGSSRVIYPAADSAVLPEHFVIRWRPFANPVKISFRILAARSEDPIWTGDAEDAAGALDSPDARQALLAYRDSSLNLQWSTAEAGGRVGFSVLSAAEEQSLNQELASWDRDTNVLMRLIGRAYSFDKRKLYCEAAQEDEAALKLAPDYCDLLERTKLAEEKANNTPRVRQLTAAIEALPTACREPDQ